MASPSCASGRISLSLFSCLCLLGMSPGYGQTLRFQDVTSAAGISTPNDANGYGHGVAAGDFNNDGLPDIYEVNYTALNALLRNNGNGTFTNIANNAGVAQSTSLEDRGVAAADYDNDGDVDIFVTTSANFSRLLYRNNGDGSFSEVASSAGLSNYGMQGQGASWGDYNKDGLLDLFLCSFDNSYRLFRQNSNHTFDDVTYQAGLDGATGSVQAVFFDFNLDGNLDLFVGRGLGLPNRLYVNRGDGTFSEESQSRGLADPDPHAQGIAVGDYDNDGDLDLYMCNDQGPNRLYRNDQGYFNEVANEARVQDNSRSLGCHFADFNNDGWLDLYVINFGKNRLYRNNGDGTFAEDTDGSGADNYDRGYGSAVLDYNSDGLLDLYFSNSGTNSNLLKNVSAANNKWLNITLRGTASNRGGVGGRVLLTSGGHQQMQQLQAGYAMVSGGGDLTFHFGLGNQNAAERVEVIWPSGQHDVLLNVSANRTIAVQEGGYGAAANDNLPPIISGVQVPVVSGASATIAWTTDEYADAQVEYGLTAAYGSVTPLDASPVTDHALGLTGLAANTTYHYRVLSRDPSGNLATSGDFTFATNSQATLLSDNFSTTNIDATKWNKGTNNGNQAAIESSALKLQSTSSQSGWIVTKYPFAGAHKIIKLKFTQPSDDGDLGMSPTVNLGSTNAFYGQNNWYRFYVYRDGHAGNYLLFAQWKRNGSVDGRDVTNGISLSGTFYLRLRTDASTIYFEYSANDANWTTVYQEPFTLPGYSLSNSFYYEISGNNTPANGILRADDFTLAEAVAPADGQPPVISQVASGSISTNAATITWNTDEAADTQVEYGLSTSYGQLSSLNTSLVTAHSANLANLSANTAYHFRARSRDAAGNLAQSGDFTFTTTAVSTPPVISNVTVSNLASTSAQVNFTTNRSTTGSVEYDTKTHGVTRLMPLGDSITEGTGSTDDTGYRSGLYNRFASFGTRFDFVGSMQYGTGIPDLDHEGHAGWTADEIYASLDNFLSAAQPQAVLLHIGTNDITSGVAASTVYNSIAAIVDRIFQRNAATKLYLSTLIPRQDSKQSVSDALNNQLPGLVASRVNAGYAMYLVDNSAAFKANVNWSSQWMYDHVHPNDAGYQVMAQQWYQTYIATEYDLRVSNTTLTTTHALALTNLLPGTIYHYRARAKDSANLESASSDFSFTTLGDQQPPVISNVAAGNLTSSSATLAWSTDEASDSQVEYGSTTAYGTSSTLDATRVTNHAVNLNGLSANTIYHYRVKSRDASGNLAASSDFSFTTTNSGGPIFSDNFSGTTLDLNKWNRATNSGNLAAVSSNQLELRSSGSQTGWVATKNSYAARNTVVSVKVTQPSDDGDLGMSPTYALSSTNGIYNQTTWYRFYVYRDVASGPYQLFVQWKKNGAVDGVDVTGNAVLNGAFYLRIRCDDTRIYFEYSLDSQAWNVAYNETFGLTGYTLNSAFYYELAGYHTDVKGVLRVDDFTISATSSGPDTQAPAISQVASGNIATTSATITWTTDEASNSQVEYGLTSSYGASSPLDGTLVTSHSVALSALTASTTYHYRVKSRDAAGNLATSSDFTLTTNGTGGNTLLSDDFNVSTLDLNKWTKGSNSGNLASVASNALNVRSSGTQTGWVITKNKYAARNTTVSVKVVQPNSDGDLGMTPTVQTSSNNGIFNQTNWYRFYVYRDVNSGPYRLYVQWKKNGVLDGLDVTGSMNITGTVYLRLRSDDSRVHFEASLNGQNWTDTYNEIFALPGYTLDTTFNFELAGYWTDSKGVLTMDDFAIVSNGTTLAKDEPQNQTEQSLPATFALSQNYPNPFQFNTHARLALPEETQVHAVVYDLTGREVQQLYSGAMPMGYREMSWDGNNTSGQRVSSGVYFLRVVLVTPTGHREVLTKQMRLMR